MKNIVAFAMIIATTIGCTSYVSDPTSCPSNKLECGAVCCPDDTHYACSNSRCVLVACDSGYQMCGGRCVSIFGQCCNNNGFCPGSVCGSNNTCQPIGSSDCGNGKYCGFGHVCINNGNSCSP